MHFVSAAVPRVLEAAMRIDSLEYTPDLGNSSSDEFKRLARDLEDELKTALFDYRTMNNGPADIFIKVTGFQPGSVMSKFHVGWRFKDSFSSPHDPIDADSLKDRLDAYLLKNGGYLYTYHVSTGSVAASNLIDLCQIDNGGCSHECRYDYQEASFTCNCPPGLYLDQTEKKCSSDLVDNTMASTEGPKFDEGPWLPMMPEEPVSTEDAEKSPEDSREGGDIHHHGDDADHVHEPELTQDEVKPSESIPEVVDTDNHGDTVDHAYEPVLTEDATKPSEGSHEDRDVYHHGDINDNVHEPVLTQDVEKPSEGSHDGRDIYHHGDAIGHDHHSLNEADGGHHSHEAKPDGNGSEEKDHPDSPMSEEATPSLKDEHRDAHSHETVVPASVGTGRSGGGDEDMTPVWIHLPGEEGVSTEVAPSNDGMDKLGIPVDSSEDTSGEEHDSDEMHNTHEHVVTLESSEMSREDDSQGSVSKESHDHVIPPVSQMTSMESHEKGSEEHDAHVVDVHYGDVNVDLNSAFNDSGKEADHGPLKSQIVSAVEHVIVKDSDESEEGDMEGHKVAMKEMASSGHQGDDHSFGVTSAHDTMDEVEIGGQSENVESEETNAGDVGGTDGTGADKFGVDGTGGMDEVEGEGAEKGTVGNGEAPVAEGTMEHDPSTITIQDVNYVINHGESQKPSEGVRDVVDGVGEVNVEEEKPQDGMEKALIDADGHKVDSVVHIKTDEGSDGQEFDSDEHVMDHEVVPVMAVGQDSAEGEGLHEMTAKMLIENDGMGHVLESKGEEEAVPEQLEGKGQVESPPEVEGSSPHPPHEKGGGIGEEELVMTPVDGAEGTVDVSKGEMGREDEGSPLIENGAPKEGLGEGVGEGSSPKEEPEGSLGGGSEGMMVEDGQSRVIDAESKGTLKPSEETPLSDPLSLNPEEHLISEDEDPNIVPVEETAKETTVDHIDLKKVVIPEIDVRLGDPKVMEDDNKEMEVTTMREEHSFEPEEKKEVTELKSEDQNSKDENSPSHNMSMPDVTLSSTSSPLENSIENLSHNSTDGVNHFPPAAENDLNAMPNHFLIPMAVNDESSVSGTTSSVRDDESNDLQLHPQSDFPQAVSNQPTSTEAFVKAVSSESGLPTATVNDSMASDGNEEGHSMDGSQAIAEEKLKKLISDTAAKLEAEIRMDSMPHVTTSTEPHTGVEEEKNAVVEDSVTPDSTMEVVNGGDGVISSESDEERRRQGGGRAQPDDGNETPSLSTLPQDFSVENANTVHSISPTSPSTILEEPSKESHASDSPALVTLDHANTEDSTKTIKDTSAPEHSISLESDNNEPTNNLATMDGEDLVAISEGKDPLIRVSAIDASLKATTEHSNEIVLASVGHQNWPTTGPGAHNATTEGETMVDEEHKGEVKEGKLGAHTKADSYEIPVKKKGEFKKPTHHEDELTKPLLFIKEGKESLSKVDKMGLLPPLATREGLITSTPGGESEGDLLTTTVDTPPASPEMTSEAIPVLPPIDKGGERLNTIAEDDSGGRKDLGKPVVKESVTKDAGDETTGEPEVVKGEFEAPNEASTEEGIAKAGEVNDEEEKGEAGVFKETVTPPENQEDTQADEEAVTKGGEEAPEPTLENLEAKVKLSEVHLLKEEPLSEQTTTVISSVSETEAPPKDAEDGIDGGGGQVSETMPSDKDESTEEVMMTVTNDSGVVTTMVTPVELEDHKNMEEMLKEMGGFGEGGHRVVAKTGVEPSPSPGAESMKPINGSVTEEMARDEITSTPIVPVVSLTNSLSQSSFEEVMPSTTPFVSVVSSTTSLPSSTSEEAMAITSKEQSPTTTMPPEDITTEVVVESIKQGNLTQNPEGLTNDTSSEGPVPTLMVHEIVTSHAISPAPQAASMEDETTTVLPSDNSAQEMNTSMPEETPMTTSPDPETMLKEETSSIVGTKGVMANATSDASMWKINETESNSLHTNEKEENHIEGVGFEVSSPSVFPDIDKHHFPKCTSGQFQCANGTSLTPYSVIPISSSSVTSLARGVACVPLSAKCDSINDCSDGSDELGCIEEGCPGNFQYSSDSEDNNVIPTLEIFAGPPGVKITPHDPKNFLSKQEPMYQPVALLTLGANLIYKDQVKSSWPGNERLRFSVEK
ncbi:serine-rich adhesin for platelets-like [Hetaerina americana]|uniref:serine-rich adhesin for platelets-like n=1 Tax=Hetaerina americana TaxID=62018 RepID=UPI003A7F3511